MRVLDSAKLFEKLGYDYVASREPGIEPPRTDTRFCDILPELCLDEELKSFGEQRLYEHQLRSLEILEKGMNLVLCAGTGSGKTEAWVMYALRKASKNEFRCIAVYPTLALANDQIRRITRYAQATNVKVFKLDAAVREQYAKGMGIQRLRMEIQSSRILITNPAFLLHEVKKLVEDPRKALLYSYFANLSMMVFDELDFYSPRSIALILGMIELITSFSRKPPQIVILTATLANAEDVCRYLEKATGRPCEVVEGRAFRVENRLYVVLGKNLRNVWLEISKYRSMVASRNDVDDEILRAFEDYEYFKKCVYKVLNYLRALGIEVPSPGLAPEEVIAHYVKDEGVTLVFTKSIARAEELAKRVQAEVERLFGKEYASMVATHHHLVPKSVRESIEEGARTGRIKIIFSPRTLTQGIDIGTVVRVVHIGLPENVREFLQREGRKGRRKEIPFTESIIFPGSRWDWELLMKGVEALKKWLSLPLEITIVNPDNKYLVLFRALAKLLSPWIPKNFDEREIQVLREVGVVKGSHHDLNKARWIWERLNFYEFGPPYGVKRYLEDSTGVRHPLEPIGHCDLVERFQPGCFDIANDAIVVGMDTGRRSRVVKAVIEVPLRNLYSRMNDAIAEAIEEYRYIKLSWGEEPSLLKDIARGKIFSYVHCVVYPPKKGFGELIKVPNRVVWMVVSDRPVVFRVGDRSVVTYARKPVYVPTNTAGEYRDYTYGIVVETSEEEDVAMLRLGLAMLMIVLRRVFGIAFETIMYGVEKLGEKKFIELHEPEAAGLLEKLDWVQVRRSIEEYQPDDLDFVLLQLVDEIAYVDMLTRGITWDQVKRVAARIVDYVLLRERIAAIVRGKKISIPKPSRANKILALDIATITIDEDSPTPKVLMAVATYDGEECRCVHDLYVKLPFAPPPRSLRELERDVEDLVEYENFRLVVSSRRSVVEELSKLNSRILQRYAEEAIDVTEMLKCVGIDPPSITQLVQSVEIEGIERIDVPSIDEIHKRISIELSRSESEDGVTVLRERVVSRILETLCRYVSQRAKAVYIAYLVAEELRKHSEGSSHS